MALHQSDTPLLLVNPWDLGSTRMLASMGFSALATTSAGFAATLGRADCAVGRDEALEHCASVVAATDLPVSADLERCFADDPDEVAVTIGLALGTGLAGCSVEDFTGRQDDPIYELAFAAERVGAAADAAHRGEAELVLTARAENHLHGRDDLDDTIARLQAFQEAGADVLYAPGLVDLDDIARVVSAVDLPVNVLVLPGGPTVPELAAAGVRRVSVGSALAWTALGAAMHAARELLDSGTFPSWDLWTAGRSARPTFTS